MRIPIYIIGLLLSISFQNIFAQNNFTYLLSGDRLASSPYVEPTPFHNTDIENSAVHHMRENTALFHFMQSLNDSSTYFKSRRRDNVNILKSSIIICHTVFATIYVSRVSENGTMIGAVCS